MAEMDQYPEEKSFDVREYPRTAPDQTIVPSDVPLKLSLTVDYPRVQTITQESVNSRFHHAALRTTLADTVLNSSKVRKSFPVIDNFQSPSWINNRTRIDKMSAIVAFIGNASTTMSPVFVIPVFQGRNATELDNLVLLTLTTSYGSLLVNVMDKDTKLYLKHLLESETIPKVFLNAQYEMQYYCTLLNAALRNFHCMTSTAEQLAKLKGRRWDIFTNDDKEPLPQFNDLLRTDKLGNPYDDLHSFVTVDQDGFLIRDKKLYIIWDLLTYNYKTPLPNLPAVFPSNGPERFKAPTRTPQPTNLEGILIPSQRKLTVGFEIEENYKDPALLRYIFETLRLYQALVKATSDYPLAFSVMNWKKGLRPLMPYLKTAAGLDFWDNVAKALTENMNMYVFVPCWYHLYFREGHTKSSTVRFKSVAYLHFKVMSLRRTQSPSFAVYTKLCGRASYEEKAFVQCLTTSDDSRYPIECTCDETGSYHEILLRLEMMAPNFVHKFKQGF